MACEQTSGAVAERRGAFIRSFHDVLLAGGSAQQGVSLCPARGAPTRGKSAQLTTTGHSPTREIVDLRVAEQDLHSAQVPRLLIDDGRFGSAHRMGSAILWAQLDPGHPLINKSSILPGAWSGCGAN